MTVRTRVAELLTVSGKKDRWGHLFDLALMTLIVLNVISVMLETMPSMLEKHGEAFVAFETFSLLIFSIEYGARIWAAPEQKWREEWEIDHSESNLSLRLQWMATPGAIVDLLAIAPSIIGTALGLDLRFLRVLRLLRLLKLTRYSGALNMLIDVLVEERRNFFAAIFILVVLIIIAASGIYIVEHNVQPDEFGSIPEAMWWAAVSLTTVGYGDVTPVTPIGKVFGAMITVIGIGMAALPAGILASGISEQLSTRRGELEQRYRAALADGKIDMAERKELEALRKELGMTRHKARMIEKNITISQPSEQRTHLCPHCGEPIE
ncbi:ion transporter [Paracoccaceae bacterium GXU_MW_L88]